jgi:hypothetical protein
MAAHNPPVARAVAGENIGITALALTVPVGVAHNSAFFKEDREQIGTENTACAEISHIEGTTQPYFKPVMFTFVYRESSAVPLAGRKCAPPHHTSL